MSQEDSAEVRGEALAYLAAHNTLSLATVGDEGPWAATVFYFNRGFTLYFLSEPKSRHATNLKANHRVAGTVNEDYRDWPLIKGVQLEGSAHQVRNLLELGSALRAYVDKYPFVAQFLKPGELLKNVAIAGRSFDVRMYKVVPTRLYYIDNARGFGRRAEVPFS